MFEFDFRNVIVLVSLAIHALLLWVLFRYGRKTQSGKAYMIAILAIAGWIAPMVLYRSDLFGDALIWARLLYVMASFTSTSFFFFTLTYPNNTKISWYTQLVVAIENLVVAILCFHPTLLIQAIVPVLNEEDIIVFGPLYPLFVAHISLFFIFGFIILFTKIRKSTGDVRKQLIMILLGYFFGSNLAMSTNLILPWMGYFELNWLGQFFSTLVAAFTTYAILKFKLLDIKIIAAEGFVLLLNLFLFFRFVTSDSGKAFSINGFVFLFVLILSFFLISSIRKEVNQRHETDRLAHSLEKANTKLKELDDLKTEFLSIATHQLRTPLSIIKGYIELIEDGIYGKPSKKLTQVLHDMDTSNERLVKLVDEFLDVTRIEQGRTQYHFEKMDFSAMVKDVLKELTEKALFKQIKFEDNVSRKIQIVADTDRLRHGVFNFVDNAIKYSPPGSIIEIVVSREKKGVAVRVRDQGPGLDQKDINNLFQKFYRSPNVSRDFEGTGLGIYVCRMFIEAHGGHVWADSKGLGKGSEFGFWIPEKQENS